MRKFGLPLYIDGAPPSLRGYCGGSRRYAKHFVSLRCFLYRRNQGGSSLRRSGGFPEGNAPAHFFTHIKQQGALAAKGRLLGLQFNALFTDRLYERLAKNALETAEIIRNGFCRKGL